MSDALTKHRMAHAFWDLIRDRHPLTWWWWQGGGQDRLSLFPSWSPQAFREEAQQWRRLAQATVGTDSDEVRHWGRYARWAASRLESGSYQDAGQPLEHANTVFEVWTVIGDFEDSAWLLEEFSSWIASIEGVGVVDAWSQNELDHQAGLLSRRIRRLKTVEPGQGRALDALQDFVDRVREKPVLTEPLPWAVSGHVFVETWRDRRRAMTRELPLLLKRPQGHREVFDDGYPHFPRIRDVVHEGVSGWWLRPRDEADMLYSGRQETDTLSVGILLALWYQRCRHEKLTWALTPLAHLEGSLAALADVIPELWPTWPPAQTGRLAQWVQQRRALAVADAWLWLEGGAPAQVASWLKRYVGDPRALKAVAWMKTHPGYYVMADRVLGERRQAAGLVGWDHDLFVSGPIMPQQLYLAPEARVG